MTIVAEIMVSVMARDAMSEKVSFWNTLRICLLIIGFLVLARIVEVDRLPIICTNSRV